MSMLAERRQKQKWSLNPRGKWWSEDSNKFGQRMLEKMGWTKGKGLGVNEQGITEYINVSHKNDTAGIGYDKNVDIWVEHQEKFNNLLKQLHENGNQNTTQKLETEDDRSMELKSKQSHARVHYKKFTQSKDINKYKPKDLANILGQKELMNTIQVKTEKDDDSYEKKSISIEKSNNGIVTINSGNMTDYFGHKLNYDKNFSCNMIDNQATNSENENKQYAGFGFVSKTENMLSNEVSRDFNEKNNYAFDNPCLGFNSPTKVILSNADSTCKKSAKKRKKEHENDTLHATKAEHNARKKLKTEIINGDCKNGLTNPALNLDINPEEECNGREFEVSRAQFGLENCGLDLTDEKNDKKCVTFNDHIILYEYNVDSTKKKKGKATLDKFEVENKKHKKKRKQENITPESNGFINEALDIETVCEEVNDNQLNEHKSKKIKRRKICKISNLETIQESPEGEKEIIEIKVESEDALDTSIVKKEETDIIDKKLKKKKKKKTKVENIIVVNTNEKLDETKEIIEGKKTKRCKSKQEEIVNSKKYKKEKKKNKESYKIEKCAIKVEISNDEQNIEILDQTNLKQHQNYSTMDENKDTTEIEVMPVVEIKNEKEEMASVKDKQKKKKSIYNEDCFKNECDIKKEISDKENIGKEQESDFKKLEKKNKKHKKSREKNVSDIDDSIDSNLEIVNANTIKQEKIEESTRTSLKKSSIVDSIENIMHSPWSAKARMSKKMLTLFQNNELLDFPGSNIRDIKGYGVDIEC
ncbi:Pin2-interacting protein X1 [Camponotus floridanus]|uniref:Pin2-interacting protein X1 n=2 Tax=Camponotus floridanus TaxID=104421 RepID=E2AAJ4_CAMFO|nr:uncharacterized protein LOC105250226 isoform X1 [Camponotus floridanus]EFN69541.1 Pin2-interacting protein X1 [Camponotus floridanus]